MDEQRNTPDEARFSDDEDGALPPLAPGSGAAPGVGRIVLAATPIGNVGDASTRLVELLATSDIVAAEDTRRLHRLVTALGVEVSGRVISYHEHNEVAKTGELLDHVRAGKTILMVSDAGDAYSLGPRVPFGGRRCCGRVDGHCGPWSFGRSDRPCPVRATHGPLLL